MRIFSISHFINLIIIIWNYDKVIIIPNINHPSYCNVRNAPSRNIHTSQQITKKKKKCINVRINGEKNHPPENIFFFRFTVCLVESSFIFYNIARGFKHTDVYILEWVILFFLLLAVTRMRYTTKMVSI